MIDRGKAISAVWYALFSLGGAALAHVWFSPNLLNVALGATGVVLAGATGYLIGDLLPQRRFLPEHPVRACWCIEAWILLPGVFAAAASALVIVLSVDLASSGSDSQKEVAKGVASALTALLTTLFIKVFEGADSDIIGARARSVLYAHYKGPQEAAVAGVVRLRANSPALLAVYSAVTIDGWGFDARRQRAAKLAERLAADRLGIDGL